MQRGTPGTVAVGGLLFEEISRLVQRSPEIVGKQRGDQGLHESYPRADHKDRKNVKLRPTVLPWYLLQLLGRYRMQPMQQDEGAMPDLPAYAARAQ